MKNIGKLQAIVDYRGSVGDRIDRRYGGFTAKSTLLHEENHRRMHAELRAASESSEKKKV